MKAMRIGLAVVMVAVAAACTAQREESPPPPGAAASVEEVAQRLDELVIPEAPLADPVAPCGQEDSRRQWPLELPLYRAQLDPGNDIADFYIHATVWPDPSEAETAIDAYLEAADDCPDAIENDGMVTEFGDVTTTTDVTPGWEGVQTILDGGFTNHSATDGDYIEITSTVRNESLMVELKWSHLLDNHSDEDEAVHRDRADDAYDLIDGVLERLAVPSETGRTVDEQAPSRQVGAALDAQQNLPDVQPTPFPSRELACNADGHTQWGDDDPWRWMTGYFELGQPDIYSGSIMAHRSWMTEDTESASAMSVDQRIVIAGNADIDQIFARYPTDFQLHRPCDGTPGTSGSCTSPDYVEEDRPYTEAGWDGTIFLRGARCEAAADAPIAESVVDVTAILHRGPVLICVKVQAGGGADLTASAEAVAAEIIEMIEAIPDR